MEVIRLSQFIVKVNRVVLVLTVFFIFSVPRFSIKSYKNLTTKSLVRLLELPLLIQSVHIYFKGPVQS